MLHVIPFCCHHSLDAATCRHWLLQVFVGSAQSPSNGAEPSSSSSSQQRSQQSHATSNGPAASSAASSSSLDRVLQARAGYIEESLQVPMHPLHARSPHAVVRGLETEVSPLYITLFSKNPNLHAQDFVRMQRKLARAV